MRRFCGPIWLLAATPVSVGLAQESICSPCVDPPAIRSRVPGLPPLPEAKDLKIYRLGSPIANLRGLDTVYGARTLTLLDSRRMTEPEAADDSATEAGQETGNGKEETPGPGAAPPGSVAEEDSVEADSDPE